jgi:ParB/RepB/Spo0J family partition protein
MTEAGAFAMLQVAEIRPNPGNPRKRFDEGALAELAASIREHGVVEPLVVTRADGKYLIICGERRWRAAQLAGLETLPCIVRDIDPEAATEIMLIENLQRQDLDPIEEAEGFRELLEHHGYTQDSLAQRVGLSAGQVETRLRLLRLPEAVRGAVAERRLAPTAALELLRVESTPIAKDLAKRFVDDPPAARAAQEAVKREVLMKGRAIYSRSYDFPFDQAECMSCAKAVTVTVDSHRGGDEQRRYCLDERCRAGKKRAWDKAQSEAALENGADSGEAIDSSKLSSNDYVPIDRAWAWQGIDRTPCETCESRRLVKFPHQTMLCCVNAVCHNNKRVAADAAEKAAEEAETKAEVLRVLEASAGKTRGIVHGDGVLFTREQVRFLVLAMLTKGDVNGLEELMRHGFNQTEALWSEEWKLWQRVPEVAAYLDSLTTAGLAGLLFDVPAWCRRDDAGAGWLREFFGLTTKADGEEFAGLRCPECESEMMKHIPGEDGQDGSFLCVNEDCQYGISETEARGLLAESDDEEGDEEVGEQPAKPELDPLDGEPVTRTEGDPNSSPIRDSEIGWILRNSVEDVNCRQNIPHLTDRELLYCLAHETRKSGRAQLLREAKRRVHQRLTSPDIDESRAWTIRLAAAETADPSGPVEIETGPEPEASAAPEPFDADEFAGFRCPECGLEMFHLNGGLTCANPECRYSRHGLTEKAARNLIAEQISDVDEEAAGS